MAVVTFVSHDGDKHQVPLDEGQSLMQVATNNAVPGIDGDCGGEAACGTCHVVVDPQWSDQVGSSGVGEEEMLAMNILISRKRGGTPMTINGSAEKTS